MRRYRAVGLACALAVPAWAGAAVVPITSRAALPGADDSLTARSLGPPGVILPGPLAATTAGGVGVTLSRSDATQPDAGIVTAERDPRIGGDFLPGEALFANSRSSLGPLAIDFAAPVSAAGLQVEGGFGGAFTARLDVYAGAALLATYSASGVAGARRDDSAPFLGVADTAPEITRLVYSITASELSLPGYLVVNQLDLAASSGTHPGVQPRLSAVPEPSALALAGAGLAGLAGAWLTRGRRA